MEECLLFFELCSLVELERYESACQSENETPTILGGNAGGRLEKWISRSKSARANTYVYIMGARSSWRCVTSSIIFQALASWTDHSLYSLYFLPVHD